MALANRLPTESRSWVEDWPIEAPDTHSSSTSTTARLAKECIAVSRRVLQRVKAHPDVSQATYHALEKSHSSLALWEAGYGVGEGKLDELLAKSQTLSKSMLGPLVNISAILTRKLIPLTHSESKQPISHQGLDDVANEAKTSLHVDFDGSSDSEDSGSDSSSSSSRANDWDEIQEDLATEVECLLVLDPIIRCPAPDIRRRRGNNGKEKMAIDWQPHQSYSDKITNRFPEATPELVDRLARGNWERFLKTKTAREENMAAAEDDPKAAELAVVVAGAGVQLEHALTDPVSSKFNDSGVGTSVRTGSSYAETVMSYQAQGRESVRVPPLPEGAKQGKPFDCVACGRQLRITNNSAWKRHLYLDLCPWICHDVTCKFGNQLFTSRQSWIEHLSLGHDFAPDWASFECPFCLRETGQGKTAISAHLSSHMEEISLAALPVGADDDHTDDSDSQSSATHESSESAASLEWPPLIAQIGERREIKNRGRKPPPYLSMTCQPGARMSHLSNIPWTVDSENSSGHHLITDQITSMLGYNAQDFTGTHVSSISITGGVVNPIGSLYITWQVSDTRDATASDDRAGSYFEVISKDSVPHSFRKLGVVFSLLASPSRKTGDSTAYIRRSSQRDRIEDLFAMAKLDTPEDSSRSGSLPWAQSSHHGSLVPGIADNRDAEMQQQAPGSESSARFFSGRSRDDYASDRASDRSDPTEVLAKIEIEDIRNRHTTWGQFTCPYPDCHRHLRGLTRKDDLYRHLQQVHGPEPYPCPHADCERHKNGLASPITFCRHIDDVHELKARGRLDFTCPYTDCEYHEGDNGFKLLNELVRHKRDVHGELSIGKSYICRRGSCADKLRLWARPDNLRLHLQRIHKLNLRPEHDLTEYIFNRDADLMGNNVTLYVCHHTPCTDKELKLYSEVPSFRVHLLKAHRITLGDDGDLSGYIYDKGATLPRNHREHPSAAYICPYEECEDKDLVWTDVRMLNEHLDLRHSQPVAVTTTHVESPNPEAHNKESIGASRDSEGTRGDKSRIKDHVYPPPTTLPTPATATYQSSSDEPLSADIGHTSRPRNVHIIANSLQPQMQVPPGLANEISVLESQFRANHPNMSPAEARRLATESLVTAMAAHQRSEANAAAEARRLQGVASGMQAPPAPQGPRGSTGNPFTAIASKERFNPTLGLVPPDRPFQCDKCIQSFSRHHDLKRHKKIHMHISPYTCDGCQKGFSRKDALRRHKQVRGCIKELGGGDAKAQPQSALVIEKKEILPFEVIRNGVMHLLALGPRTKHSVFDRLGCEDDWNFTQGFNSAAALESPKSQIWQLKQSLWTKLDVWAYEGYTPEERDKVIHNATIQYNLMKLSLTDPAWDRLLPEEERKGGEEPSDSPQSGPEPPAQSSPEWRRNSLPEEAASRPTQKPRVNGYRQTSNVRIAPKIARHNSFSDEDKGVPSRHGESRDLDAYLSKLAHIANSEVKRRMMDAGKLLAANGLNPDLLSTEQIIAFASQIQTAQTTSLAVLAQHMAKQVQSAYPSSGEDKSNAASASTAKTQSTQQQYEGEGNTATVDYNMQLMLQEERKKLGEMRDNMTRETAALAWLPGNVQPPPPPRPGLSTWSPSHECPFCAQLFSRYTELREHASTAHNASDLFPCALCSSYFQTYDELRRHLSARHPSTNSAASSSEGYPTAAADSPLRIGSLSSVEYVPPPLPPPRFPTPYTSEVQECPICSWSYSSHTDLYAHAWAMHGIAELFPCEMCVSCFQTREELLGHVSTRHTSTDSAASSSEGYHNAVAADRPSRIASLPGNVPPPLPPPRFPISFPSSWHCPECGLPYSSQSRLSEHIRTTHGLNLPPQEYRNKPSIYAPIPDEASDGDTSMKSLSPAPTRTGVVLPPPSPTVSHQSFTGPEPPNPFARLPAINEALPSIHPPAPSMEFRAPMVGANFAPEGPPNPFARPPPRAPFHSEPSSSRSSDALTAQTLVLDALSARKGPAAASADSYTDTPHGNPDRSYVDERSPPQTRPFTQVTHSQTQSVASPGSGQAEEI